MRSHYTTPTALWDGSITGDLIDRTAENLYPTKTALFSKSQIKTDDNKQKQN